MKTILPPITRAIPEIVRARGMSAIRDWLETDCPWIETYGCQYHGYTVARKPNVAGFWRKAKGRGYRTFRPLATLNPRESL